MPTFHPETPKKCRPPKGANPPNGTFFRYVFNNPPTPEDFVIWIDEPENRHLLDDRKRKNKCGAFAVSILKEEGLQRSIGLFLRQLMIKKAIKRKSTFLGLAQVELNSNSGVIKQTGQNPYHYDLWPYVNSKLECNVVSIREIRS